ncbi:13226_t:CDS:2, partial [Funneliformis geosporum]
GTNDSDINNLVRRQPHQPKKVEVNAGNRTWIFKRNNQQIPVYEYNANQCTLGFAVKKVLGYQPFNHGFLILGSSREEAVRLGDVRNLKYDPANGLNYAILRLLPNNEQYTL